MFQTNYFTKENIAQRILRRSAELWGYEEAQLDQFDPLVKLLIEASSVEFEKVGQEIQDTEVRLMARLAKVLCPEVSNSPQPASAIAQARSVESLGWIMPENQLVYKRTNAGKGEPTELIFTPAGKFPLVNAAILYIVTPEALHKIEKGTRNLLAEGRLKPDGERCLWLGVEMDQGISSWEGFRFYFDWPNDPGQTGYAEFLSSTHWSVDGKTLEPVAGLYSGIEVNEALVLGKENRFVYINDKEPWGKEGPLRQDYPPALEETFDKRSLLTLKQPLVWVKIKWPVTFPLKGYENMTVVLNAFPVWNKQLHKLTYRLQPGLNGIALPSGDAFMGIHAVVNQQNQTYMSSEKNVYQMEETASRVYTLRQQGVGRFDQRNAKALLYQLMELLHDEVAAFNSMGEDFLTSILREMMQNMARIEQKLGTKKAAQISKQPFLVIRGEKNPDLLSITYWTTFAESANGLPAGSRLQTYAASSLKNNEIILLTRSVGGRPCPDETEYVDQLRKNIMTRNRLVTLEDIRAFCKVMLGDRISKVEAKRHFIQGNLPGQGFIQCLQIQLMVADEMPDREEWNTTCDLLRMKIEELASGVCPVQVTAV